MCSLSPLSAKMGSQVLVPFRGSEDCHRHLKLMGDLGQVMVISLFSAVHCQIYILSWVLIGGISVVADIQVLTYM